MQKAARPGRSRVSEAKAVVLLVRADPEPVVVSVALSRDRALAPADFDRIGAAFLLES
jgi:hypothetical protein